MQSPAITAAAEPASSKPTAGKQRLCGACDITEQGISRLRCRAFAAAAAAAAAAIAAAATCATLTAVTSCAAQLPNCDGTLHYYKQHQLPSRAWNGGVVLYGVLSLQNGGAQLGR
jgi:hypothetical protein